MSTTTFKEVLRASTDVGNLHFMKKRSLDKKLVKVDDRGRVSLVGFEADGYYEVSKDEQGRITLSPVSVVPAYLATQLRATTGSGAMGR